MTPTASDSRAAEHRAARFPRGPLVTLLLGALLSTGTASADARVDDDLFERHQITLGPAKRHTIVTGFFLNGATAQVAAVRVGENGEPRLRIYGFDGAAWAPVLDATLRPGVRFVDVAEISGRDRLITYEPGRFNWFDPDSATERELVEVAIRHGAFEPGEVPRVDVTRDLNHDGRDDLVMPDLDGFWISIQLADGSFSDSVKLGPPEPLLDATLLEGNRTYGEEGITTETLPWFLSRIYEMDYDLDGRSDLVFWSEDHFDVHRQDESGRFSPTPETFTTEVPFDSAGAYSLAFRFGDRGTFSLMFGLGKIIRRTVLHSIRDLNGDGVGDLVTLTVAGRNMRRQSSRYEVHFGAPTGGATSFTRVAGTAIEPRGKAGGMEPWGYASRRWRDLDGDGRIDVVLTDVDTAISGMLRALVGNSVSLDLEIFRNDDGAYPEEATARRRIRRFAPFAGPGNVFFPAVLTGDVNGDGRVDLLVGRSPGELQVFLGVPGPELLAPRPRKVAVSLPQDERRTWLADLDGNGKQDVLVHHPAAREPHRVTILLAR